MIVVGLNFEKKRNFASGIATSGAGIGAFVFSPLLALMFETYGYSGLMTFLASIMANICVLGCLYRPSFYELSRKKMIKINKRKHGEDKKTVLEQCVSYIKFVCVPPVVCICISIFFASLGVYMVYLHLTQYIVVMGTDILSASYLLSIAGVSTTISRVLTGIIASFQKANETYIYSGSFGLLGVSTLLFPFYSKVYIGQVIYSLVLGAFYGNCYCLISSINVSIAGIENLASLFGLEMFFCGIGNLIGPLIAGKNN